MEDNKEKQSGGAGNTEEENSLEGGTSTVATPETAVKEVAKKGAGAKVRGIISHLNIYFLMFIFIVVLSGGIVFIGMQKNKKAETPTTITTQPLTQEALSKIKDTEAKVGDPKQTLTIESNAIFSGKVLIRDSLDVAGGIKVGSALSLPGLSVSGTSTFDQLQTNKLTSTGDASIQGSLSVQKALTVSGGGSFGGPVTAPQITVQSLQLSGDLQIVRHIDAGGGTPGKSDGTALGNGGTSSVSGTDTAGTVTINTGGSPGTGCFVTVTFTQRFGGTPHIAITPVGSAAAGLNYYTSRSTTNFSICTTNPAPAGQNFSFDYVAID